MTPSQQLANYFPPMIHPDGANITREEVEKHYETHVLPPKEEVEKLIAERESAPIETECESTPMIINILIGVIVVLFAIPTIGVLIFQHFMDRGSAKK